MSLSYQNLNYSFSSPHSRICYKILGPESSKDHEDDVLDFGLLQKS